MNLSDDGLLLVGLALVIGGAVLLAWALRLRGRARRLQSRLASLQSENDGLRRASQALDQAAHDQQNLLALLDTLLTDAPVGLGFLDRNFRFVRVNAALAHLDGLPIADHLGRTIDELLPQLAPSLEPAYQRILETDAPFINLELEGDTPTSPGRRRTWLASFYPVKAAGGALQGAGIVVLDITDFREAEAAQRESQRFIQHIADTSPNVLYVYELKAGGRVLYINSAIERILGYTAAAVLAGGANFVAGQLHPDDLAGADHFVRRLRQAAPGAIVESEFRLRNAEGQFRWLHTRDVIFARDEAGGPSQIIGVATDITDSRRALETLRNSEESFRLIFAHTPLPAWIYDLDSEAFLEVNKEAVARYGYSRDEFLRMNVGDIRLPHEEPPLVGERRRKPTPQPTPGTQSRHRLKSGELIDVLTVFHTVEFQGRWAALAISQDITKRKQAEREMIRRSEELAALNQMSQALNRLVEPAAILQLVPTLIGGVLDARSLYIALYDEARQLVTYPIRTVRGQPVDAPPHAPDRSAAGYVLRTRAPLVVAHDLEATLAGLGLEAAPPLCRSFMAVPMLAGGKALGVIGLQNFDAEQAYTDSQVDLLSTIANQTAIALENARLFSAAQQELGERVRAEETLAQQAAELASLYRASAELLAHGDDVRALADQIAQVLTREFDFADCGVLLVDDARTELIRLARAGQYEVRTTSPLPLSGPGLTVEAARSGQMIYAADVAADPRYMNNVSSTRSELSVPLRASSGEVIGVIDLQSAEPNAFDERARRVVTAFAERAERALENAQLLARLKLARQMAEESSQLKSEFLASTSHELRTPLTAILGSLNIVLNNLCESIDEERRFVQIAYTSARNLLNIVNDVLDMARIEAGRMGVSPETIEIATVLAEAYMLMQIPAGEKGLALNMSLPPEPAPLVWADPDKLRQILLNLIGNAIKFTEAGGVTIDTEAVGQHVHIRIRDTGIGIAPDRQARLFQPFVQVDGSTTRRYGGTGLGLSISRRLADLMGGSIGLFSAGEGQGTTVTLSLRLAADDLAPDAASA